MQHESDNKREVDKLIARAGAIDLDNDKLMHALANQRCMTDGWHALVIGGCSSLKFMPIKKQKSVVSPEGPILRWPHPVLWMRPPPRVPPTWMMTTSTIGTPRRIDVIPRTNMGGGSARASAVL